MPEQFLHDAQLGAVVEQVRRERMPQQVRMYTLVDAGLERVLADKDLDRALGERVPFAESQAR